MSPDHDRNGMSESNGSHGQLPEKIFNENNFWLSYGNITVHFWALVMCVKSGQLKTRYEFAPIINEGINRSWAQSNTWEIACRRFHGVIGSCWPHLFICCRPWPQAKDTVNAYSFRGGFLGPWDGMAEPAMVAVAMVRGGRRHGLRCTKSTLDITVIYGNFAATIPTILVL